MYFPEMLVPPPPQPAARRTVAIRTARTRTRYRFTCRLLSCVKFLVIRPAHSTVRHSSSVVTACHRPREFRLLSRCRIQSLSTTCRFLLDRNISGYYFSAFAIPRRQDHRVRLLFQYLAEGTCRHPADVLVLVPQGTGEGLNRPWVSYLPERPCRYPADTPALVPQCLDEGLNRPWVSYVSED